MTFKAKVANALSFAHLAGLGRGKAKASDEDDKKDRDHEDSTDGAKGKAKGKADGDEPDEDDKKKDDPDARAEDDTDTDAEDDAPEKKDEDDEKAKAGAKRERARCAAIFASPAAAKNVGMAAELAFNTDLSAAQAISLLGKAPVASTNANRAAGNPRIGTGGGTEATGKQAIDSRWDRAFSSVTPQRRK